MLGAIGFGMLLCFGTAMASKISSVSDILISRLERELLSPFSDLNASCGPPSTAVTSPREEVDNLQPPEDIRLSFLSIFKVSGVTLAEGCVGYLSVCISILIIAS
jgi:hypothetical protein